MGEVIFSKFSTERKKQYGIVTKILEDGDRRSVVKEAISPAARAHVQKMPEQMHILQNYYQDAGLRVAECHPLNLNSVEFEYINGVQYDEYMEQILRCKDYDRLKQELLMLKQEISNVTELTGFRVTEEFCEVFGSGNYSMLTGKKAYTVSNIDLIFANLLMQDGKLFITDYEWVFGFPVPVDYVLYRSLLLCSEISTLPQNVRDDIYQSLQIDEEEQKIYLQMEQEFQNYVSGKNLFREYNKTIKNGVFSLKNVPEKVMKKYAELSKITEDGQTQLVECREYTGKDLELSQTLENNDKGAVFALDCEGAVIKVSEIVAVADGELQPNIDITSNAELIIGEDYYFGNQHPRFEIANKGYERVTVRFHIYHENTELVKDYILCIKESADSREKLSNAEYRLMLKDGDIKYKDEMIAAQDEKIKELTQQILALGDELGAVKQELAQIQSTRAWRVYHKLTGKSSKE